MASTLYPFAFQILQEIKALPEGAVVTARRLSHLGKRAIVERALRDLVEHFKIYTIAPMTYVMPIAGDEKQRWPDLAKIIKSLADLRRAPIVDGGFIAAFRFGLLEYPPYTKYFVTSGKTETIMVAGEVISIQHVARWQLEHYERPAGAAFRAIAHMGQNAATRVVSHLRSVLPNEDWEILKGAGGEVPAWVIDAIAAAEPARA